MKKLILIAIFTNLIYANDLFNLTIDVKDLKNNNGVVRYSIYNDPSKFPDEDLDKYYKQKTATISKQSSHIVFKDLKKGVYCVNILHDENNNGKLDKGFMLPKEGVGLSNYSSINLFHKPNFEDASFLLDRDKTISIKINYF